jgi:hypothetical protein
MTAAHRRGARREQQTADVLRVERTKYRPRYQRASDTTPVRLPTGDTLQPEVKTRKRAPKLVLDALAKARGYLPGAIPLAVISQTGGEPIACLPLRDLARLLGLQPSVDGQQLVLGRAT